MTIASIRRSVLDLGWLAYRHVRPHLPDRHQRLAGVPTARMNKFGDACLPRSWPIEHRDQPYYESGLVEGIRRSVRPGDTVVNVGGGVGIIAILAAKLAGASGKVICYEGSREQHDAIKANLDLNRTRNVELHHRIVAKPVCVYGDAAQHAERLPPADLPPCDVLEMDCEGSEIEILETMRIQPRAVIVETHGSLGAPTERVASLLQARRYEVSDLGPAEHAIKRYCIAKDIRVLLARSR